MTATDTAATTKLYEVEIRCYVAARNQAEAESFVRHGDLRGDLDMCDIGVYETDSVDAKWANVIPFGEHESDETCIQIIRRNLNPGEGVPS